MKLTAGSISVPRPGMTPRRGGVAPVVSDPQNDFLGPSGVAWGVAGQSVQEVRTVENIERLLKAARSSRARTRSSAPGRTTSCFSCARPASAR